MEGAQQSAEPVRSLEQWLPWAVGLVAGLVVMGPALGPGSLFNLDLVVMPDLQVPRGMWGLGPELPRRVPYVAPLAWMAAVVPGTVVIKAFMVATIAVAVAGMARLTRPFGPWAAIGAGLLYGVGPWFLTRVFVGHFAIHLAAALLPWAVPTLLRPGRSLTRTALWCLALGVAGIAGGQMAALLVAAGLITGSAGRRLKVVAVFVAAQLPWLVPGVVVLAQGAQPADAAYFRTEIHGLTGLFGLVSGTGFWRDGAQLGGNDNAVAAFVGLVLLGLAAIGHTQLPPWRRGLLIAGTTALAIAVASGLDLTTGIYSALADTAVGAPLREGQRLLAVWLLWLVPASVAGARRLLLARRGASRAVLEVLPVGLALLLMAPAVWGFGGRLEPARLDDGWADTVSAVESRPGVTLALPFQQYLPLREAGGAVVHNPIPISFPGDVLASAGGLEGSTIAERAEPRAEAVDAVLDDHEAGEPLGPALAELGVRWVVLLHDGRWQSYEDLHLEDGLERVVTSPRIELLEVRGWVGNATTPEGAAIDVEPHVTPLAGTDGRAGTWNRGWAAGWMQGSAALTEGPDGRVQLAGGSGVLWYWPTGLVLAGDAVAIALLLVASRRRGFGRWVRSRTAGPERR